MRALLCLFVLLVAVAGCTLNESGNLVATSKGDLSNGAPPREAYDARLREACDTGDLTERGSEHLLRAPYLQLVSAREASVLWTTDATDSGSLELRRADARSRASESDVYDPFHDATAELPAGDQFHARAGGLEPSTLYCYRLVGAGGAWTEWTGFRTAPPRGAPETVRFAALGDLGEDTLDQHAVLTAMEEVPLDLVVITGDVAYDSGTTEDIEDHFFAVYDRMLAEVPFVPVAGNHDLETDDGAPFRAAFALPENGAPMGRERWYSFDWGDVHFVAVDTDRVGPAQARWLEADLAGTGARWTVVFAHSPPYSSGTHGSDRQVRETFSPIFEAYGVDLVLLGHDHNYERTVSIGGVTYIVTGGGGRGTRPVGASNFTAFAAEVSHFVYVIAEQDRLTAYAIDASGQLFDSVAIQPR